MKINIVELAKSVATKAHEGQFRKNGQTPYIEHPKAVAAKVREWMYDDDVALKEGVLKLKQEVFYHFYIDWQTIRDYVEAVAFLHDVKEDCNLTTQDLLDKELPKHVVDAVDVLTKKLDGDYLSYLFRVKSNPIARIVKVADIRHNMSDLEAGHKKDKYGLAVYTLLSWP